MLHAHNLLPHGVLMAQALATIAQCRQPGTTHYCSECTPANKQNHRVTTETDTDQLFAQQGRYAWALSASGGHQQQHQGRSADPQPDRANLVR